MMTKCFFVCLFYSFLSFVFAAEKINYYISIYTTRINVELLIPHQPSLVDAFNFSGNFPTTAFFNGEQVSVSFAVAPPNHSLFPDSLNLWVIGNASLTLTKTPTGFNLQLLNFTQNLPFDVGCTTSSKYQNGSRVWNYFDGCSIDNFFLHFNNSLVFTSYLIDQSQWSAKDLDTTVYFTDNNIHFYYTQYLEGCKLSNLRFLRPPNAPLTTIRSNTSIPYTYADRSNFDVVPYHSQAISSAKKLLSLSYVVVPVAVFVVLIGVLLLFKVDKQPKPHRRRTVKNKIPKKSRHGSEDHQSSPERKL